MRISDWSSDVCSSDLLRQHLARDLLGHVWLHVLLALEGVVELAPGGKRVGRLRFEDRHHQPRLRLRDRDEQRAGGDVRSEEHTSELQSLMRISYAVFCLKKKKTHSKTQQHNNTRPKHNTKQHTYEIKV